MIGLWSGKNAPEPTKCLLNLLSTLSIVLTELFCGQDFFIWLSPNTLLKRKTFLKTIVPLFVKSLSSPVTDIVGEKGDNLV